MGSKNKLRAWCLLRDQFAHVNPVEVFLGDCAEFIYDSTWEPRRMLGASPDLVLCVNDVHYGVARCLDAARTAGIPSLVLQDGILEWRCQYENPRLGAGGGAPQHQPVLADKIACIGPSSARHIASWGNTAKVEVTGMPRLDYLLRREGPPNRRPGCRLLVMTAKKPGFTQSQTRLTLRSLSDLKEYFRSHAEIEVVWRLTKDLSSQLGVENRLKSLAGSELADLLAQVDAVITTPSTAMLEGMIVDRPVACLDYHNAPRFVPTAWTISAPPHIGSVVEEMLAPPSAKMAFQRECLQDCLSCGSPASPRVAELIVGMAAAAQAATRQGRRPHLPAGMLALTHPTSGECLAPLADVYPGSKVFQDNDIQSLQARLARAENENLRLAGQQSQRGIGYWIQLAGRETARRLKTRQLGAGQ
ncbi:MAG TPA: hypothetical protein VML01_08195 [Bryobacterales bacterium]|nr:hypothetical protein [Bryobacterales bacterium]